MNLLGPDHDIGGSLQEPEVVVVATRRHRGTGLRVMDASFPVAAILGSIGRSPEELPPRVAAMASFGAERDNAVLWVHDERGPSGRFAPVEPEGVVRPGVAGWRRLVARERVQVDRGNFFLGEPLASRVSRRPLQRGNRRERPVSLEIGVAPRRSRDCPIRQGGLLRLARGSHWHDQRPRDQQPTTSCALDHSSLSSWSSNPDGSTLDHRRRRTCSQPLGDGHAIRGGEVVCCDLPRRNRCF